ncbi:MAG: ATP-binding cassette domain-containing protein [Planctomycetaceae bacterium]|jgi:hypothetical protein|nr:ATP-binding cassette domain-containing protein [Planctomycetaceae bacterium]
MNQSEINTFVNPFSTKFWTPGTIPFQFCEKENEKEWDINVLIEQKIKYGSIMQIVGSHGSGKSTLLRTLLQHFKQQHFVIRLEVLNDCQHKLPPDFLPIEHNRRMFYMIDGYKQLSLLERIGLRFQNWSLTGGLLLTTHKPILGIPILYRTIPQFELFVQLVQELTKTYSATYSHSFGTTELYEIYHRAGGNFRTAFFELYDKVQITQDQ